MGKHPAEAEGEYLTTKGTFGPILSTVITDSAHGQTTWDHWEQNGGGMLAVYRFAVPKKQSHYAVSLERTAYHGEVAIDPATGTILRLAVQADPDFDAPFLRGDILVAYGPLEIGGKTCTCPLMRVSIWLAAMEFAGGSNGLGFSTPHPSLFNDVTFDDYHLFRSNVRILTGDPAASNH